MAKSKKLIDGLPVVDAKVDLLVTVKEADIRGSTKKSTIECAAARAITRQFHTKEARVFLTRALVQDSKGKQWDRYMTPQNLRTELVTFDRAGVFQPDDYILRAPRGSQRLGYTPPNKNNSKGRGTGKVPRPRHVMVGVRPSAPKGHQTVFEDD